MRAAMRSRLNVDLVSKIMVYPRDGHNHRPSSDGMMSIFYHFLEKLHGLVVKNFCVLQAFLEPSFFPDHRNNTGAGHEAMSPLCQSLLHKQE